ncbi:serine/threonine-protein kinase [Micromonospora sp. MH99]|uniref:serine/threonine-protein kinase n=1 Tax=Micromonospora sp. MH99 TaxID=1945510 RepID=UPI001F2F6BD7|nr:serine/threonine-protein kinase [Micromonospora sp. MH99]MCF0097340.1 Serine/threonine-protein kinase PrkC [Micromonospora sp. MH99]
MLIAGRYRLLDLVGRGGMGRVWRARDEMLHREVAVKEVVPPSWLADHERAELRSRTLREARAAARLNHPAVVRLYDVVPVEGSPWIVMEYVPSRTLQDVIDAEGPLEPARAARIGLALLGALEAAHTAGVLHRDVKPQNVLVAHDGRVMLADFGLATFDGGDGAMTRPGMVLGSPQYVAPERAAEGVSTVAADLWSLGATLHAAVEGRSPYARSNAMATLSALAAGPPDPAPHAGPLAPVLAGLLRRDPRDRLDHDGARRLLTAAATGHPGPPAQLREAAVDAATHSSPATSSPNSNGSSASAASAAGEAADQDVTIPLPEPDPAATSCGEPGVRAAAEETAPYPATPERSGGRPAGLLAGRPRARRAALVVTALLVAAAAGVGTALAVAGDAPTDNAGRSTAPTADRPNDGSGTNEGSGDGRGGPYGGGGPGRPGPPPNGRDVPPPPFPCVHPDVAGPPVAAGSPASGERFRPPTGWVWHADSTGFRVSVPASWHYSREGPVVCFQDPATGRALSVAPGTAADPLTRLRSARDDAARIGALPNYDEIRLNAGGGGAEWECRWAAPYGVVLHARQEVLPPESWTLGWITDDRDWTAADADWRTVRKSFRPPR